LALIYIYTLKRPRYIAHAEKAEKELAALSEEYSSEEWVH
jgi:hypothetical protein